MSYKVIARKYRPQLFAEIVGQQHVTRTLANAIESNRVAHAYIFSGARGVGKTTAARILAKALNCAKGPTPHPDNTCDSCRDISAGTSLDVLEIDAASNRGIEQIRELREMVRYAPAAARYKVVILDEAHQLTDEASNALLKTLEDIYHTGGYLGYAGQPGLLSFFGCVSSDIKQNGSSTEGGCKEN